MEADQGEDRKARESTLNHPSRTHRKAAWEKHPEIEEESPYAAFLHIHDVIFLEGQIFFVALGDLGKVNWNGLALAIPIHAQDGGIVG